MNEKIISIAREKTQDWSGRTIPTAWVRQTNSITLIPHTQLVRRATPTPSFNADQPVLIMLGEHNQQLLDLMKTAAEAGARVYLLARAGFSSQWLDQSKFSRVLVRTLPSPPPATALLTSRDSGWLWLTTSGSQQPTQWTLELDNLQAQSLYLLFLRKFWLEAQQEAWTGSGPLAFRAPRERPFDIPELPSQSPVDLVPPTKNITIPSGSACMYQYKTVRPAARLERLWCSPDGNDHAELASMLKLGTDVVGELPGIAGALGLPDVVSNGVTGSILLPEHDGHHLRVELNRKQAEEFYQLLLEPVAPWQFRMNLVLNECRDDQVYWLPDAQTVQELPATKLHHLPALTATTLRDMPGTEPAAFPEPDILTRSVRYDWQVRPPVAPADHKKSALYSTWEQLDQSYLKRIEQCELKLHAITQHREKLGNRFKRLASQLLGFRRGHDATGEDIAALKASTPSLSGKDDTHQLMQKLAEIEETLSRQESDQQKSEIQAEEEEAREKQNNAWQQRTAAARDKLKELDQQIPDCRGKVEALQQELVALAPPQPESATESENAPEAATSKDKAARKKKLQDELSRELARLKRLESDRKSQSDIADTPFTYVAPPKKIAPQSAGKGAFVPTTTKPTSTRTIPGENLPLVGLLLESKGQRYLQIEYWSELDQGEKEAERLKASLVARHEK